MHSFALKNGKYLSEYPVSGSSTFKVRPPINWLMIFDRSGSTHYDLPKLVEDLKILCRKIPSGDTLSLGWFSSEGGQYDFFLKGWRVGSEDFQGLDHLLDQMKSSLSLTCFSEILDEAKTVVETLKVMSGSTSFVLSFFTDGYPIVSNYSREIEKIHTAIKNLSGKISAIQLVGYGPYYNKALLADMAKRFGGVLVHANDVRKYRIALEEFSETQSGFSSTPVQLEDLKHAKFVFALSGKDVISLEPDSKGVVQVPGGSNSLYVVSDNPPSQKGKFCQVDELLPALYGASYLASTQMDVDSALEFLNATRDIAPMKLLMNANLNSEYGAAEELIREAITSPTKRYTEGKAQGDFVPDRNAFCFLDALDTLTSDPEARFHLSKEWRASYKPIGTKITPSPDAPKFDAEEDVFVPLYDDGDGGNLVWNESRLNLSIRCTIPGHILLRPGHETYGLASCFPTRVIRNYTLVRDGIPNVKVLLVSMSQASFDLLSRHGLLPPDTPWASGRAYELDLMKVPVMNRAMVDEVKSAVPICQNTLRIQELKAHLKVWRDAYETEFPKEERKLEGFSVLSQDAAKFLSEHYITARGFEPPTTSAPGTDFYEATSFKIAMKGFSNLPKVEEVKIRLREGKKLTPVMEFMVKALSGIEAEISPISGDSSLPSVRETIMRLKISELKSELAFLRRKTNRAKMSILLGKRWPEEFSSRDECEIAVDGYSFTFKREKVKVDY